MNQTYPLHNTQAEEFYARCNELLHEDDRVSPKTRFLLIRPFIRDILTVVTENELQFFSTLYSRLVYVFDKYSIELSIRSQVQDLVRATSLVKRQPSTECTNEDCRTGSSIIAEFICALSGMSIPTTLDGMLRSSSLIFREKIFTYEAQRIPLIRCIVRAIQDHSNNNKKHCIINCESEEYGLFRCHVWDEDVHSIIGLWNGATLHLFNYIQKNDKDLHPTAHSHIVIEPDVLIDATSIAECFQGQDANPLFYFLDKMTESESSQAMAIGSIVNFCLDEMLTSDDWNVVEFIRRAYKAKPLAMLVGFEESETEIADVAAIIQDHLERLQTTITHLQYDSISTEPSFISPLYGIQGRLDLLLEYQDNEHRKTIIELKSGTAPKHTFHQTQTTNSLTADGMWINHLAQVTCYNLLLDSAYQKRTGDSQILYSKSNEYPLRNAPNILSIKKSVLSLRNKIIVLEHGLIERRFSVLHQLISTPFVVPSYKQNALANLRSLYSSLSQQEKLYIQAWMSFLVRENYSQRIGNGERTNGFATLWRDTVEEKIERYSILANLNYSPQQSDVQSLHLCFTFSEATPESSSFRENDIVVLYPTQPDGTVKPHKGQMIRGTIKKILATSVIISLRNKQFNPEYFKAYSLWHCEPDFVDGSTSSMLSSLFRLFTIDERKKKVLLGVEQPLSSPITLEPIPQATDEQQRIIAAALSAKDYYLLQGPPGTGKTSVMLKNIIHQLHNDPNETILVSSYTNRALDEVCTAIRSISPEVEVLRCGSRDNTVHQEISLSQFAQTDDVTLIRKRIKRCRIIACTVSFAQANPELFRLKSFTTLVLDEASQVTEPQLLAIITRVQRMILIGDERQLPSVITQSAHECTVNHPLLSELGITDLRQSLFERLLRKCKANGWSNAYGMLTKQARMHHVIQDFVSQEFYGNKLTPLLSMQTSLYESEMILQQYGRIAFIATGRDRRAKINQEEALQCVEIVHKYADRVGDKLHPHSIGIITPFRAQIHEIRRNLRSDLRPFITIDTVERYQGSERDVIILSCAVNHVSQMHSLQSLIDFDGILIDRKLNVALTRARQQCIIIGCEEIISQTYHYRNLLEYIRTYQQSRTL